MFDPRHLHRVYHRLWKRGVPLVPVLLYRLNRLLTACDLPPSVTLGKDVRFQHWGGGVVIADYVEIGDSALVLPNSRVLRLDPASRSPITIGDRAQLGSYCTVLASSELHIGPGAQLCVGTVFRHSVSAGRSVIGEHASTLPKALRSWKAPLINPATIQRASRWFFLRRVPLLPALFYRLNVILNHSLVPPDVQLGRRVRMGRRSGLLAGTTTGDDLIMHANTGVIRNVRHGQGCAQGRVVIGNSVELGVGAVVIASNLIEIGDGARIETGAIVTRSVPAGSTAAGVPARIVSNPISGAPD